MRFLDPTAIHVPFGPGAFDPDAALCYFWFIDIIIQSYPCPCNLYK